jgi:hypothetical protein
LNAERSGSIDFKPFACLAHTPVHDDDQRELLILRTAAAAAAAELILIIIIIIIICMYVSREKQKRYS